jgi:dTDP-4-dehydrorhamnose 3,5-epimerase
VIYVSTDYVFAGDKPGEYAEDDPVGPLNVYGKTKLEGEHHIDPAVDLIVRSSWVYGSGRNFIRAVLNASLRDPVRVVDDQRGRPTSAGDLAAALVYLIDEEANGTIHVAGDGEPCTWADLAETALALGGREGAVVRIDTPTYIAEADRIVAPRPPNSALALAKAKSLGVPLLDWKRSVRDYMEAGA